MPGVTGLDLRIYDFPNRIRLYTDKEGHLGSLALSSTWVFIMNMSGEMTACLEYKEEWGGSGWVEWGWECSVASL